MRTFLNNGRPEQQPTSPSEVEPAMPVNRLKEMVEVPRPAMSPWEAAAKFGTVDPAFAHMSAATETSTAGDGAGAERVKSLTAQHDPAASQCDASLVFLLSAIEQPVQLFSL